MPARTPKAKRLSNPDPALWDELLAHSPQASFFQTPLHARILAESSGRCAELLAFRLEDGTRIGLPILARGERRLRPDYDSPGGGLPGGILCDAPQSPARVEALLQALERTAQASFHLGFEPASVPALAAAPARSVRRDRFFVLDLEGGYERGVQQRFAKDFREQCRKAERRGVRVGFETGAGAFAAFGELHANASADWAPEARKTAAFFQACARAAQAGDTPLRLALARSEDDAGRVVAGVLSARRGDSVACWLAAMDRSARRLSPSAAAYRFLIEEACAAGARRLLLGCSGGIASIEAFKRSLGAEGHACIYALEVRGRARQWLRRTRDVTAALRPGA